MPPTVTVYRALPKPNPSFPVLACGECGVCGRLVSYRDPRRVVASYYADDGTWTGQSILHLRCVPDGVDVLPSRTVRKPPAPSGRRRVPCPDCGLPVAAAFLDSHRGGSRCGPRTCPDCGRTFTEAYALRKHRDGRCPATRNDPGDAGAVRSA